MIVRGNWDKSNKQFEVLRIEYRWNKYTRKLRNVPTWRHLKYYNTIESALDATKDFRNSLLDKAYYDYPGSELEDKYPHLEPTIIIIRYKATLRDDINV